MNTKKPTGMSHPEEIIIQLYINPFQKNKKFTNAKKVYWYTNHKNGHIIEGLKETNNYITFELPSKELFNGGAIVTSKFNCTNDTEIRCQIWNESEYYNKGKKILPSILNICPGHRNTLSITGAEIRKKGDI